MSMNSTWRYLVQDILVNGKIYAPRKKVIKELSHSTIAIDMSYPVLTDPVRKLSYQGMAAEAHWICTGDDRLAGIEPWLPRMKEFSDDGIRLSGAYGPKIMAQLDYVLQKLRADDQTRQATLTLWQPNPLQSKDYPCTIAMDFKLRDNRLNMHVFMRSSDAWLGVPYDVFSFSMVAHLVCCRLNGGVSVNPVKPGVLYLTAASSHLYEENWLRALECCSPAHKIREDSQYLVPEILYQEEHRLLYRLRELRSTKPGDRLRWWESGK